MTEECEVCGRDMVQTFAGTYHEPAEYECPTCDGGLDPHEADGWDEPDMDEQGPDEDTTPARA